MLNALVSPPAASEKCSSQYSRAVIALRQSDVCVQRAPDAVICFNARGSTPRRDICDVQLYVPYKSFWTYVAVVLLHRELGGHCKPQIQT